VAAAAWAVCVLAFMAKGNPGKSFSCFRPLPRRLELMVVRMSLPSPSTSPSAESGARPAERDWLHRGGRAGSWGSLGCWGAATPDYASACEALARRVASAAAVSAGSRVLCVACGAGDELQLLAGPLECREVVGVEHDRALVNAARGLMAGSGAGVPVSVPVPVRVNVLLGDGCALGALGLAPASFDQVLCVDAAYHLRPRSAFLRQAFALLRPGGRLAYTDLCLQPVVEGASAFWRGPVLQRALLRGAARLCGLSAQDLLPAAAQVVRLQGLGFSDVQQERLDDAVLGGFARFVRQQALRPEPRGAASTANAARRARWTARLVAPCRAAGLGYVLLSGRKPSSDVATA
jgi:SAM-dependent methyltransferase